MMYNSALDNVIIIFYLSITGCKWTRNHDISNKTIKLTADGRVGL